MTAHESVPTTELAGAELPMTAPHAPHGGPREAIRRPTAAEAVAEAKVISWMAVPCVAGTVLSFANRMVPTLLVGHLGAAELASASLAVMFSNVLGFSICFGISTALDTLASQAVTGSKNPRQAGIFLQRAILINLALTIPLTVGWFLAEPLLRLVGQDAELSRMAGQYIRVLWIGLFPMIISNCVAKFLIAQGIMQVQFLVSLITVPVNVGLGYLLTFVDWPLNLGFYGTAAASVVTETLAMILTLLYTWRVNGHQCWTPWSREALRGWKAFIKLGLPGMLMTCAEWWVFELVALMAGLLGPLQLAAQAVLINTVATTFMIVVGLSVVAGARVGNHLGAGDAVAASHASTVSVGIGMVTSFAIAAVLFGLRFILPYAFTSEPEVVDLVASVLPIVALFQLPDAAVCIVNGILRGCGKQKVGAIFVMSAYYIIGVPLGILLTFVAKVGLPGMWIGLAGALFGCFIAQTFYMIRIIDWRAEVAMALARVNDSRKGVSLNDEEDEDMKKSESAETLV
ncbi:ethionine resistance protein [Blastocladiella emersonii ATCC 22665]|nr:ethionine resistance protein [Blastocladiella emersonii ATCC 22665]